MIRQADPGFILDYGEGVRTVHAFEYVVPLHLYFGVFVDKNDLYHHRQGLGEFNVDELTGHIIQTRQPG